MKAKYIIKNFPDTVAENEKAIFFSRISVAYRDLEKFTDCIPEVVSAVNDHGEQKTLASAEQKTSDFSALAITPLYTFERLILPEKTLTALKNSARIFEVRKLVFEEWGLSEIEPHPKSALNFYGPPGTGKSMAAHAIASLLGCKIIVASYAEIESKYHGDGPKNVKALFAEAERLQAVLFIDEADSLLSKRLTNVSQGSEQAINSMRSQLLICLEQFSGVVIFATNLVENYDKAFESRITYIGFSLPDKENRAKIWEKHLPKKMPLADDISLAALADIPDVSGRDIRNAVLQAAVDAAVDGRIVSQKDLQEKITQIKEARISGTKGTASARDATELERKLLAEKIKSKISEMKNEL